MFEFLPSLHGDEEGLDVVGGAADEVDQTHLAARKGVAENLREGDSVIFQSLKSHSHYWHINIIVKII